MFPTFIGILDIQSWWEVPSIAHFCSLFRAAFNLLDFDIEDLEEALLTDGGSEGRLVQELIVRLLEGCLPNDTRNDISTFNYQMFLRRLFRKKCQEYKCENPFNTDVDFELLPLRQKVEILRALCDFRLDAEDVEQSLSNLDSDSLRVEPLGHDRKDSAYWYFYGTRLYREDYIDTSNSILHKQRNKPRDKKRKRRRNRVAQEEEEEEEKEENSLVDQESKKRESVWQVVCFTQQDWSRLVEKFRDSEYDTERKLYRTLSENFMPEIPKLFDLKEKQQRRRLLQRNNSRVLRSHEPSLQMETGQQIMLRSKIKTKTNKSPKKATLPAKEENSLLISPPVQKKGRQTNNSLASAVGQIVIHTQDEVESLEKKKGIINHGDSNYIGANYGYKYGFGIEEEERRVGMHKVLESLKDHVDAWPFIDPVDEEYAPRYYSVVRKPMDLSTMEEKLDGGSYKNLSQFKRDFRLIVDNCRQYNGSDNEYTEMAINLKEAFDKAVNRYLESEASSDEDPEPPKQILVSPTSPSCPSRLSSPASPQHNIRKRSKKSAKKSKSTKLESRKSKIIEKVEEEEKKGKNLRITKKKKGKKKCRKAKDKDSENEEDEDEQESENGLEEVSVGKARRGKNAENNAVSKTKKLLSKEVEQKKTNKKVNKKVIKEKHTQKKDAEHLESTKESKENKRRKEDFEEDYDSLVIVKSKSRKIEKKDYEDTGILENTKRSTLKKSKCQETDTLPVKTENVKKKSRKKEKVSVKSVLESSEKLDNRTRVKEKEKVSKSKPEEVIRNGKYKNQTDSKEVELELKAKESDLSKKFAALIGNEDLESLDGLKDKISERRREEKMKNEKEKEKKLGKTDVQSSFSKKVPSNGSTFHEDRRKKVKKRTKEDKANSIAENGKNHEQDGNDSKKAKIGQTKHGKVFGKEESSAIQALNQATEQTLHDINKWLDDAPRLSEFSSGSDSPVFHPTEPSRPGPKLEKSDKLEKPEAPRKRPSSIKIFGPHGPTRPKKVQRTIDRLQPGKSKGNLLLKKPNANAADLNLPSVNKQSNEPVKESEDEPKLSLGTVLKNVDSIQLICKSLVSSPNPNLSNDEEEDVAAVCSTDANNLKEEKPEVKEVPEEAQKPKSATPNLSAWFKAFGAPKSKKKEEEPEEGVKKDPAEFAGRPRRMSTGGSSVSESVSSFSQESPPGSGSSNFSRKSPQNSALIIPEPQIRGAGFYQDALSTGSSPYNSPYYATPPRYSAQLPPTPSPQNHPLSPAYPATANFETNLYSQNFVQNSPGNQNSAGFPQNAAQTGATASFSQQSPGQANLPENLPQESVVGKYPQQLNYSQASEENVAAKYSQQSPQDPNYSQNSPQEAVAEKYAQQPPQQVNYSDSTPAVVTGRYHQQSPQQSGYSQNSPQETVAGKYSQQSNFSLSPQPDVAARKYPEESPRQSDYSQNSTQEVVTAKYSQPSPQQPNYSQNSPQEIVAGKYSQQSSYSESSPQEVAAGNYSQQSPQQPNYTENSPGSVAAKYSQQSPQPLSYSPNSPQESAAKYSQQSPQPASYSPNSPQESVAGKYAQQPAQQISYSPNPQENLVGKYPQQLSYSQNSPQESVAGKYPQQSDYSQKSPRENVGKYPQPPSQQLNYSANSPQPSIAANYSQPSPRQSNYPPNSPQPSVAGNYSQQSPRQASYSPHSPQQNIVVNYPQPSPQPSYPQPSPQPSGSTKYSQPSPQPNVPANYSQPSPQQNIVAGYSQPSPQQTIAANYSQPSPQQNLAASYSQPSPQQTIATKYPHSAAQPNIVAKYPQQSPQPTVAAKYPEHSPQQQASYSQNSPQQRASYSPNSPQQQAAYSQNSPRPAQPNQQPPGYSQMSPQPPASYSQPSPQPPASYTQPSPQPPASYTQPSPQPPASYAQPSPQPPASYTQPSPQPPASYTQPSPQPPASYTQPSPQPPASYTQPSPQPAANYTQPSPHPPANYSQPSPQPPANYSQPSPQPPANYSQPSPQPPAMFPQPSPQPATFSHQQPSPQPQNYSQQAPQQIPNFSQPSPQQNYSHSPSYPQLSPQQQQPGANYSQPSPQQSSNTQHPASFSQNTGQANVNPAIQYSQQQQAKSSEEYAQQFKQNISYLQPAPAPPLNETERRGDYLKPGNPEKPPANFPNPAQQVYQPNQYAPPFSNSFSIPRHNQEQQQPSDRLTFTDLNESLNAQKYSQQRSFLTKTASSDQDSSQLLTFQQNSLYQSGFQPSGYSRPVYPSPHYFDSSTKQNSDSSAGNPSASLPPVKKRIYNESNEASRSAQEQFNFDPMIGISQDAVTSNQFDAGFVGSLADSVAGNPAYARLGLGLVRGKEQQQLLTIPRPAAKADRLSYPRNPTATELDLNLLQNLPKPSRKADGAPAKTKKRKSKQQQEQQPAVAASSSAGGNEQAFPQFAGTPDPIGLKNSPGIPTGSAFNFAATSNTGNSPFYDKDTAAAAAFAFLDEFRNPNSYYSMLRQQQQQQVNSVAENSQACGKISNQPRNYPPHPFLHSAQRSASYGHPVSAYVTPHGPNIAVDPAAYQQYIHSLYALQPPHHHRPSWL